MANSREGILPGKDGNVQIITTGAAGNLCGYNAIATQIAQLKVKEKDKIYQTLRLTEEQIQLLNNDTYENGFKTHQGTLTPKLQDLSELLVQQQAIQFQKAVLNPTYDDPSYTQFVIKTLNQFNQPTFIDQNRIGLIAHSLGLTYQIIDKNTPANKVRSDVDISIFHSENPGHFSGLDRRKKDKAFVATNNTQPLPDANIVPLPLQKENIAPPSNNPSSRKSSAIALFPDKTDTKLVSMPTLKQRLAEITSNFGKAQELSSASEALEQSSVTDLQIDLDFELACVLQAEELETGNTLDNEEALNRLNKQIFSQSAKKNEASQVSFFYNHIFSQPVKAAEQKTAQNDPSTDHKSRPS